MDDGYYWVRRYRGAHWQLAKFGPPPGAHIPGSWWLYPGYEETEELADVYEIGPRVEPPND